MTDPNQKVQLMSGPFQRILDFLDPLQEAYLAYDLKHVRESLMLVGAVPQPTARSSSS